MQISATNQTSQAMLTKQNHQEKNTLVNFTENLPKNQSAQTANLATKQTGISLVSDNISSINSLKFGSLQAYGYTTDIDGFMGHDFSKAAGLPENFKLHKSALDELSRYANDTHIINGLKTSENKIKIFENIDMADTIKHYYKLFSQVTSGVITSEKDTYSIAELRQLPKGYSTSKTAYDAKGHFLSDISNAQVSILYSNNSELNEAKILSRELSHAQVRMIVKELDFSMQDTKTGFKPDMSVYQNKEGYTKEAIFMNFLKSIRPLPSESGKTMLTQEALKELNLMHADTSDNFLEFENIEKNENNLKQLIIERLKNLSLLLYAKNQGKDTDMIPLGEHERWSPANSDIDALAKSWNDKIQRIAF